MRGEEHIVHARLGDQAKPLTHGQEVVLVGYDAERGLFEASAPANLALKDGG
jgi:hypothetical protein